MKGFIIVLLTCGTFLVSCKKDKIYSGTYTGMFFYTNPASSMMSPQVGPASITFNENYYTSTGNQNKRPAGGSGTFEFTNAKKIKFHDINIWTADFDWGLVLNGEYSYRTRGDSLHLTKYVSGFKVYEYRLKRTIY